MKTYLWVIPIDAHLLVSLGYVLSDLQWRVAYAATSVGHERGYAPSFMYSVFTQVFTLKGPSGSLALTSPPTLDWVQVLAVLLVLLNGWWLYTSLSSRRKAPTAQPLTAA